MCLPPLASDHIITKPIDCRSEMGQIYLRLTLDNTQISIRCNNNKFHSNLSALTIILSRAEELICSIALVNLCGLSRTRVLWSPIWGLLQYDITIRNSSHDDVIKWKHFPRYWPFVRGIHRPPTITMHNCGVTIIVALLSWRGALVFSLISASINDSVNEREAGDLRRHHAHYDVTKMLKSTPGTSRLPRTCSLIS